MTNSHGIALRQAIPGIALAVASVIALARPLEAQGVDSALTIGAEKGLRCTHEPLAAAELRGQLTTRMAFRIGEDTLERREITAWFDTLGRPRRLFVMALPAPHSDKVVATTVVAAFDSAGAAGGFVIESPLTRTGSEATLDTGADRREPEPLTFSQGKDALKFARWLWEMRCPMNPPT